MLKRKRFLFYSAISAVLLVALALLMILPFQVSISSSGGLLSLNITGEQIHAAPLSDWQIKFNQTGTSIEDGTLYIRLDFYPSPESKVYGSCYVNMPVVPPEGYQGARDKNGFILDSRDYQAWLDLLPHTWQLNPALCVFVAVPEDITAQNLFDYAALKYNADTVATIDNALVETNSAHLISPYMRDKTSMTSTKVQATDKTALINAVNIRLSGFTAGSTAAGTPESIVSQSTDIGPGATDRASATAGEYTVVEVGNPANASDPLDTVEVWANTNITGFRFGTAYVVTGGTYHTRDSAVIGSVTSGSKQTFTGKSITCVTGDNAIWYLPASSGAIEQSQSGADGIGYASGEYIDAGDEWSYTLLSGWADSVYATGGGGAPAITNTPASRAFGTLKNAQTYFSNNLTLGYAPTFALADAQCYFTVTNSGTASGNITASATNFTGGISANLTDSHPDANHIRLSLFRSGDTNISDNTTLTTTPRAFITSLAASATKKWEIMIETPTSDTAFDNVQKTCTITLSISSP